MAQSNNPELVKAQRRRDKRRRDQEIADLRELLAVIHGRRFIWRLLTLAGSFRLSFDDSPQRMAFNEGMRNIGLMLIADLQEVDPDAFTRMMVEASEAAKSQVPLAEPESSDG